jgi:hypothetical protein
MQSACDSDLVSVTVRGVSRDTWAAFRARARAEDRSAAAQVRWLIAATVGSGRAAGAADGEESETAVT